MRATTFPTVLSPRSLAPCLTSSALVDVFWGEHEPAPPVSEPVNLARDPSKPHKYDFSGRRDLFGFIAAAATHGLSVILRIGPYVCAEVSYGGFPFRLRDVPGIEFRTYNAVFMAQVGRWVRFIARELHARSLMAPAGGPVILVQLENEYEMVSDTYGNVGAQYLQWCADLQRELEFGVPAIMCYGAADGVVETINSFYAHKEIAQHRSRHADQPPVWTECWTGWYDVWGAPHHRRGTEDLAYAAARFFAQGGAGINYYMWMGGTNFGRSPMYLQTTSYDYDAPIDEFYLSTTKSNHLTALHTVLLESFAPLFFQSVDRDPEPVGIATNVVTYTWGGRLCFICNDSQTEAACDVKIFAPNSAKSYVRTLLPFSVQVLDFQTGDILFDTASVALEHVVNRTRRAVETRTSVAWQSAVEPIPRPATIETLAAKSKGVRAVVKSSDGMPTEQLLLTQDSSDYCFYTASFSIEGVAQRNENVQIRFECGDFARVYLDGVFVGCSATPLWEDRRTNKWNRYDLAGVVAPGLMHTIAAPTTAFPASGIVDLTIMTASLGLIKGDWQLGERANMLEERKGLLSEVTVSGGGLTAARVTGWQALAKTHGEVAQFDCKEIPDCGNMAALEVPVWRSCTVTVSEVSGAWIVDLSTYGKGILFVNGILLGRFWDIVGKREKNGFLHDAPVTQDNPNMGPTQSATHVPPWVAGSPDSDGRYSLRFVFFQESGGAIPPSLSLARVE